MLLHMEFSCCTQIAIRAPSKASYRTYLGSAAGPHSEKGSAAWQCFSQQTWPSWLRSEGVCPRRRLACLCLCRRVSRLASGWTLQGLHTTTSEPNRVGLVALMHYMQSLCKLCSKMTSCSHGFLAPC